ncbi:MAG: 50S ribosomal protein L14e [Nanoarchaeales archaeon]|nr:50S ribosomal protein L14e [Nanoarchaeales archaeon]
MLLEVGRLVVKTAGRDAMEYGVIVEKIDDNYFLVDGNTRRKKVNKSHLEPVGKVLDIKKGTVEDVRAALDGAGIELKVRGEARVAKSQVKAESADTKKSKK